MSRRFDRVIILGLDGLDPIMCERMVGQGRMPHFASLAERGSYCRLQTSNPAQSPVAWMTMATGCNPGWHGVYDFVRPIPEKLSIELSIEKTRTGKDGMPEHLRVRAVDAFWDDTSAAGLPTTVIRWPVTFPAEEVTGGFVAGLGTPDVQGRLGKYTLYATAPPKQGSRGADKVTVVVRLGALITTEIEGPLKSGLLGVRPVKLPMRIAILPGARAVELRPEDAEPVRVAVGAWSPWIHLRFRVSPSRTVRAKARAYLASIEPELSLYLSPREVDARDQSLPVIAPESYAAELVSLLGDFYTLGMPEDTNGVREGRFDEAAFLSTCDDVLGERTKHLEFELSRNDTGVLAFVVDSFDRIQHLFWPGVDLGHPFRDHAWRARWGHVVEDTYVKADSLIGMAVEALGPRDLLLVVSDHGFTTFRHAVHLNRWLLDHGYLAIGDVEAARHGGVLAGIDWANTRAYACGFGGIYLNQRGREQQGIVSPGDALALRDEIKRGLAHMVDNATGQRPVRRAYVRDEVFNGPLEGLAPDVLVGLSPGYRASWQTALGATPESLIEPNLDAWCGDHLMDPSSVPGILVSSEPLDVAAAPGVWDIAPTVLSALGLPLRAEMLTKGLVPRE